MLHDVSLLHDMFVTPVLTNSGKIFVGYVLKERVQSNFLEPKGGTAITKSRKIFVGHVQKENKFKIIS